MKYQVNRTTALNSVPGVENEGNGEEQQGVLEGERKVNSNSQACQNACASMCDEVVTLWKLAALNPCISPAERETLKQRLIQYHKTVIEKVSC